MVPFGVAQGRWIIRSPFLRRRLDSAPPEALVLDGANGYAIRSKTLVEKFGRSRAIGVRKMPALASTASFGGILAGPTGSSRVAHGRRSIELQCPSCKNALTALPYHLLGSLTEPIWCPNCSFLMEQLQGIWLGLTKERQKHFAPFLKDYEAVRRAEGRGSDDPNFYLSLPFEDQTRRNSWQWSIRGRTYRYMERAILPGLREETSSQPIILDLGAGNGWLSYRLAKSGYRPIAVDLQLNTFDGLGAAKHYLADLPALFPRFQAEVDRLPFADDQFDCAVFNASFHYSENYDLTLAETIRCLRPGGTVVIADSPFYKREESGLRMVEERQKQFQRTFGFQSNALSSCEYLTTNRLVALEAKHSLVWAKHRVWYGMRWACRPIKARLSKRREPSQFHVYTAQVKTQ